MKTLSIRQPWAWLIIHGDPPKDIENRSWKTGVRGRIGIHAAKKIDRAAYDRLVEKVALPPIEELKTGGIIGSVDLVDCVTESDSPWFEGDVGFVLADPEPCRFKPCRGKLGFFTP